MHSNEPADQQDDAPKPAAGIYIDSTALAKVYMPEPESELLDEFLRGLEDLITLNLSLRRSFPQLGAEGARDLSVPNKPMQSGDAVVELMD